MKYIISIFRKARLRARLVAITGAAVLVVGVAGAYAYRDTPSLPVMGEAAGVLAVIFIVLSLLLMLRVPTLARWCGGLETMYSLHRGFGLAGYGLALLHPLLLATDTGWEVLSLYGKDFGFRSGWTGLLILMVVLLCTFWLKTHGYAIWRRLHTLSILAFMLMAWHVVSYQNHFPVAGQVALYAVLGIGMLVPLARYFLIDQGGMARSFQVEAVGHPTPDVVEMQLQPQGAPLAIQPGQFVFARFAPPGGCRHFHPFTASAVMDDGSLRLSIKASGACTRAMQHIRPGTQALLQGPYGELFQNARQNTQVWIAGGIGITPFLARARALDAHHVPVRLFYLFDDVQSAAYLDELEAIARAKPVLSLHAVATHGAADMMASIFDALLPPWNDKQYVLCGSEGFTGSVRAYLTYNRVRPDAIAQERFEFR